MGRSSAVLDADSLRTPGSHVVAWRTPTSDLYTLSLHDALPIYGLSHGVLERQVLESGDHDELRVQLVGQSDAERLGDRKSTRLNSSHLGISYAVFCLKKINRRRLSAQNHQSARVGPQPTPDRKT